MKVAICPDCGKRRIVIRHVIGAGKIRRDQLVLRAHGCPSDRKPATGVVDVTFRRRATS